MKTAAIGVADLSFRREMQYRQFVSQVGETPIRSIQTGGPMAQETAEEKLARLEAENRALREQIDQRKPGELRLKISEKGALSVYGLGRFPVTLYKEQWARLLDHAHEIKRFLHENDPNLKAKR
jgi:hypothetical protein